MQGEQLTCAVPNKKNGPADALQQKLKCANT